MVPVSGLDKSGVSGLAFVVKAPVFKRFHHHALIDIFIQPAVVF